MALSLKRYSAVSAKRCYMDFPMRSYTKRGGIDAIDNWKTVKKHFA